MPTAAQSGLKGLCPRCGQGRLFAGFLKFADECEACGADFRIEDAGDGPAFFVLTATSFILVPMALVVHFKTGLSFALTILIFGALIIGVSLAMLRPLRGLFFAQQWKRDALEATRNDLER